MRTAALGRPMTRLAAGLCLATMLCACGPRAADLGSSRDLGLNVEPGTGPVVTDTEAVDGLKDYLAAAGDAATSGDLTQLRDRTDPFCPCQSLVDYLDAAFKAGHHFDGVVYEASDLTVLGTGRGTAQLRAQVQVSAYEVKSATGAVIDEQPSQAYEAAYSMQRQGGVLVVVDVREK
jgi:hypothetical protein